MGEFGVALAGGLTRGIAQGQQAAQERALQKSVLDLQQKKFKLEEQESTLKMQMLQQQIQQSGGTVEFYTYEDDNHNLSGFFTTAMNRTIEFFDLHLQR